MRGKRISELPPAQSVVDSDLFVIARGRQNYRIDASSVRSALGNQVIIPDPGGFYLKYQVVASTTPIFMNTPGLVRLNAAAPAQVTQIHLHATTADSFQAASLLQAIPPGSWIQIASLANRASAVVYRITAVSVSSWLVQISVEYLAGTWSWSPGNFVGISWALGGSSGLQQILLAGRPVSGGPPQDGQVLYYDGAQQSWVPASLSVPVIRRVEVDFGHVAFLAPLSSVQIDAGSVPEGAKVTGVTIRVKAPFAGVSNVQVSLGAWKDPNWIDPESYCSKIPLSPGQAPGHHDVALYLSATEETHRAVLRFSADGNFGNGVNSFLSGGRIIVLWSVQMLPQ